jgi:DNA-binding beta-propeller fold protein YncE
MNFRPQESILSAVTVALVLAAHGWAAAAASPFTIRIEPLGTYASGIFNQSGAEIVAHDKKTQRLFTVNALSGKVDVLDIDTPLSPQLLFSIDVSPWGSAANSVATHNGVVAVAVENAVRTDNGHAVFFDADGEFIAVVEVGALPDMLTFTPNGRHVLVANEGEPSGDYLTDPEGSVSIIDLPGNIRKLNQSHVRTATFAKFNNAVLDPAIRIFGPGATVAQDLEPEYITVSHNSRTAWVALQEANAIAVLDISPGEFTALHALGFKDHLLPDQGLDVSDQDGMIAVRNWPVLGMYHPDGMASYSYQGATYLVTANEGDSRDYAGFSEESRFRALSGNIPPCADSPRLQAFFADNPMGITTLAQLRDNVNGMGRLTVTTATGLRADGSCYEDIYVFGARSFSIWRADDLTQVYDSGEDFERITADMFPDNFNSDHAENNFDNRSDNKGPEPEDVKVAKLWGRTYAFIGLERIGGIMIYDISNPHAPFFVQYLNNRDFSGQPATPAAGDLGAEGLLIIEAGRSPIPGVPLLVVANEVSGTTTLFRIDREPLGDNP